jgi:hypothetical protein
MQIKSQSTAARADTSAQDAERYGMRLAEISDHLATLSGEDAARARELLKQAAEAAREASGLIAGRNPAKVRLHVNTGNQPDILVEAAKFLLEKNRGNTPVTLHSGASRQNLPYGVQLTARLVSQLRALLSDKAAWTEKVD